MHALDALMGQDMGAEPAVKLQMRALDQQMVVHLAEDRAETIGIVPVPCAAFAFGGETISGEGRLVRAETLEKAVRAARFERKAQAVREMGEKIRRSRREGADQDAAAAFVWPEHGEGVGMPTGDDFLDVGVARAIHFLCHGVRTGTFQTSSAYSAIVRSEENQPVRAVLRIAERHHDLRSRQRLATFICVVT